MKRPTQKDVAQKAGVSRATVSLIINNQNGNVRISQETRERVQAAIDELGYQPDMAAQTLRTSRTNLLALLIPDITNPFYPALIRGAQSITEQQDYQLLIYDSDDSPIREQSFVDTILRRRVDGVILVSFRLPADEYKKLLRAGIKVVSIGQVSTQEDIDISKTIQDHSTAIKQLINHLVKKGHQKIAHIAGSQDTPPGQLRLASYKKALEEENIPYDPKLIRIGNFRQEGIADIVYSLMNDLPKASRPTAIFAANDVMAIETIYSLTKLGIRVPEDVAVCGFDDIPQSSWIMPSLTTVSQNPYEHGKQAAKLLLEQLQTPESEPAKVVDVPFQLVFREST
ncbi:MAG: LacI family DNA-binding transcriptional regulator [Chloroflexota bacterium]